MIVTKHQYGVDITGTKQAVDLIAKALEGLRLPSYPPDKPKTFKCPDCNSTVVDEVCRVDRVISRVIDICEYLPGSYGLIYGAADLKKTNLKIEMYVCAGCKKEFKELNPECVFDA